MKATDVRPRSPDFYHAHFRISYADLKASYEKTFALWTGYLAKASKSPKLAHRGFTVPELQVLIERAHRAIQLCQCHIESNAP